MLASQSNEYLLFFPLCTQFMQVLQRELDAIEKDKDAFIKDFSEVFCFFHLDCLSDTVDSSLFSVLKCF